MRGELVRCSAVAEVLPTIVDGSRRVDGLVVRHVERCLTCQAEVARYRRMLRLLHQMREERQAPAAGPGPSLPAAAGARAGHQVVRSVPGAGSHPWARGVRGAGAAAGALAGLGTVALVAVARHGRRERPVSLGRRPHLRSLPV